ncbi:MAG: GDSL family lipase [Lachnospiraceae bacterium]|nr:GDSL family lipase [Lachnospiraceae bacterium]
MNLLENKSSYRLSGRTTWQEDVLYLGYSASFLEFCFRGTKVEAEFVTDRLDWEDKFRAWIAVFVDGAEEPFLRFPLTKERESFVLFESNEEKETTIRVMKYSEAAFGAAGIASVDITGEILPPPAAKEKKIEVIGDSITCGYGIEGIVEKDTFTTAQENPWNAYGCRVARTLDTEVSLISWSGNGIISHYVEETVNEPRNDEPLMPELYRYADLSADLRRGKAPAEYIQRDFTEYQPQLVIINLGTNDGSYTRYMPERGRAFVNGYVKFLREVREVNPSANILCTVGLMRQETNALVKEAVERVNAFGDNKVFFLEAFLQDEKEDGLGADYHPTEQTQKKFGEFLVDYITKQGLI